MSRFFLIIFLLLCQLSSVSFAGADNFARTERERGKLTQAGFASEEDLYRDINERFLREDYKSAVRLAKQYFSIGYRLHKNEVQELEALSSSRQ